jgi:hypothetical protein
VIPVQMPEPGLVRLVEPFGDFSPMGVLWSSIGASRGYERFAGSAELAGGMLLFLPQTATLGALICLADTIQIFTLNMAYDVPVKLFSLHLLLLSLFLLAPEADRLINVLLNRAAGPSRLSSMGRSARARRNALLLQVGIGVCLVTASLMTARQAWTQYGGGAPKSPLYGVWNIETMSIDGQTRPPLLTDADRFRRVIFDRPDFVVVQLMNDNFQYYGARIDTAGRMVTLTGAPNGPSIGSLAFQQPSSDRLVLTGTFLGQEVRIEGRLFDRNNFLLVSRGFHRVQEYPFNR